MEEGSTFVELLVYLTIVFLILSFILPNSKVWIERVGSIAEINKIRSSIRYARLLSTLRNNRVDVRISKRSVEVVSDKNIVRTSSIDFVRIEGNKYLAFSNGVPYISGTLRFFVGNSFIAKISITPVIGKINLTWKW